MQTADPAPLASRFAVVFAAALLGQASSAAAQSAEFNGARPIPGWVLMPTVSFGVVADDNPVLAGEGDPRTDDTITNVRPSLDLTFTGKRTSFDMGYRGSLVRYRTLDQYDTYDQGGRLELRHQPSKHVTLTVRDNLSISPTTDAVDDASGVPFARAGTRQNTFSAGASVAVSPLLDVTGTYNFQWLDFQAAGTPYAALLQGGRSHGVTLGARRRMSDRWTLGLDYSLQLAKVGEVGIGLGQEQFTVQSAEGVVLYQATPSVQLHGGFGVSYLALSDPDGSRTGPAGEIGVRKRTEYALLYLRARRSFVPAFGFGGSLQNQEMTGGVYVPFARRRAYLNGRIAWRESEPVLDPSLRLETLLSEGRIGYAFRRWLRLEAFYNRVWQDSILVAGGQVDRNRFGVQVVTGQPVRLQ